ncbi:MAG: hypothetical protein ACRC8A_08355 [Microcoleaceae cyanobacterium]
MQRLRNRAFEILSTEVSQYAQGDFVSEVGRKIVMQRLEKLRSQPGNPLSFDELREVVSDQFPNFDEDVLKRTAQINSPAKIATWVLWGTAALVSLCATVWIANLPFSFIRKPIAQKAPLLLLPSQIVADRNYQQATTLFNQAEQRFQQAKTSADLDRVQQPLEEANRFLQQLPTHALETYPKQYCSVVQCRWKFTLQEYQTTQNNLEQLQAKVLQNKQAQKQLAQAQAALNSARQRYQNSQSSSERNQAMLAWQSALDQLTQVPADTLAWKSAQTQHNQAQQQFQATIGATAPTQNVDSLFLLAQQYAEKAASTAQKPPHPEARWNEAIALWQQAIQQLERVSADSPSYSKAQEKLPEYQSNLQDLETRLQEEQDSVATLKAARQMIAEWRELAHTQDPSLRSLTRKLNQIIDTLEEVKPGTTVSGEAQDLLRATRYTRSQL